MAALDTDNALQFAVMLQAGLPAREAILYFAESEDPAEIAAQCQRWLRSRAVRAAMATLMKKPWQNMSLDERCRYALDQHYGQLAYLLHSQHYAEADPAHKAKLDTARTAIETKLAGMAGKTDALSQFLADLRTGTRRVGPGALIGPEERLSGPADR
jgi:hypothetical protein